MTPQTLFTLTVAASLANGLVSPALGLAFVLHPLWLPAIVPATPEIVLYGASLIVATGTLLLSAVPAALAERLGVSGEAALRIWLAGASALTALGVLARA
ncbi:hypothetical protein [Caldovatus aquaticus]|uniref:MFS transporter n=1 Tax=Caldovatus aquaticus TaxID=2865671 RepID=A0ABS7F2Q4_9PROT|nr:hypothetical protein [Caldovatus aquaticus]MBW8269882.1 hypothetical protein [Caldovatus aquaticus]